MGDTHQNILERLGDRMRRGELTAAEANVELIRAERVRLITGRMPREIRMALNAAVKAGLLGHLKKDGLKPEAYYHPTFDYRAHAERNQAERVSVAILRRYAGFPDPTTTRDAVAQPTEEAQDV